ncbi:MAG TPA: DHA2 family efflux MFS transporter permease subunit [Methanotrichaceae archaeon]|nr:DHA2 family efflux MFS transporter permease subunit [Methanotrichaceae archaeon]
MPYSKSQAYPRETAQDRRIVMLLILTGILMFVIDGSVVNIALPTITAYFQADVAQSQWVITSYLVTVTSLLIVFGKLSEYTGKTKLFLAGFALFTLASVACGLSASLDMLILFRAVQAVGAAAAFSISAALIFEIYPAGERGKAMGYIGSTVSLASIAGPMLGGYLVDFFGWQYIFLINVPIGIVLLALATRYMKLEEERAKHLRIDWLGAIGMIAFVVSLMMLLGELAESFSINAYVIAYSLVFLASLVAFVIHESRHKEPLLDLSVFRVKKFVLPNISLILFIVSSFAVFILGPFYFQGVMGYTPSQVGTLFLIVPVIMAVGSPIGGWVYDKYHYKYSSALGMLIVVASLLIAAYSFRSVDERAMILSFVLMGIGNAIAHGPISTEIMSGLPNSMLGTASSLSSAVRNLGMALGVSISSILLTQQLNWAGYYGSVLQASPEMLSVTISNVMIIAGGMCLLGTAVAALRNLDAP